MTEAFIYDAVRTPRGRGKKDGSLHEVKPIALLAGLLDAICRTATTRHRAGRRRRHGLRLAGRRAGRGHRQDGGARRRAGTSGRRRAAQPLLRLGPRGGEHGGAEGALGLGGPRRRRRRRVACRACRSAPTAAPGRMDPETNFDTDVRAAGHRRRPDRHARRLDARGRRRLRARVAAARRAARKTGALRQELVAGRGRDRPHHPRRRRVHPAGTTLEGLGALKVVVRRIGEMGFDAVALQRYRRSSASSTCTPPATRRASSTAPPQC